MGMDPMTALTATFIIGGGLVWCGFYIAKKSYEKVIMVVFNELQEAKLLDKKKCYEHLKSKGLAR